MKSHVLKFLLAVLIFASGASADEVILSDGPRSSADLSGEWGMLPIDGLQFQFPPPESGWKKQGIPSVEIAGLKSQGGPYCPNVAEVLTKDRKDFLRKTGVAAWFKREFTLPKSAVANRRVLLRFEGMAFKSEVWVNGKKVGSSLFGQLPSSYEITDALREGKPNELVVGLTDREGLVDLANQTFIAPASGVCVGIWGKVELQFVPLVRIDDVFVKTSVKNKRIDFDVSLLNAGTKPATVSVGALLSDVKQIPTAEITPVPVTIAPGESKTITLSKDWIAPHLWSPKDPALYFAKVSISQPGSTVDSSTIRFGFREFEIRGRDFFLNGVRTVLLRNSHLSDLTARRANMFSEVRAEAGNPINCIRLHIGFDSAALLDLCDELGVMSVPESAWHNAVDAKTPVAKAALWLPNVESYTRQLIKLHRNRPSVVIWSLTNESIWGSTSPEHMRVADGLLAAAKEVDPTRPFGGDGEVNWGGRLSVINLHYPESTIGNSLRSKYPNSGAVLPNDAHWLQKDAENGSWRAKFMWDRPLILGEYWYPSGEADNLSSFMGESVYDWQKWRAQRMDGRDVGSASDNEFVRSQQVLTDAYRQDGVAGVNPWASDGNKAMPRLALRPVDFFPNFKSGSTGVRKFVVFNDSGRGYGNMNLQCRLTVNGEPVWEKVIPASVGPGETKTFEIPVECPAVTRQVQAELSLRLRSEQGGGWHQLDRSTETVFIMPPENLAGLDAKNIFLLSNDGRTSTALSALGLTLKPSPTVTAGDLQGKKVLIVGEETDPSAGKDVIVDFVKAGGTAIVLRQDAWGPLVGELPECDKEHLSTRSWLRTYDHPITAGMDDRQFSYWRPDHLVSIKTFRKPAAGNFQSLLDCGGLYGLRWSPLLEVPVGRGTFLLSSLDLVKKVGVEPAAGHLLANMVRYASSRQQPIRLPLRLLDHDNKALRAALIAAGVVFEGGLGERGPILLDVSFAPTADDLAKIKSRLAAGGHVWLHGFGSETIKNVASLFPFEPVLQPWDPTVQAAVRRSEDPLMNNLSSFDFFWTRVDLEARADYFAGAHPTAKVGGLELKLPNLDAGVRLVAPALLVKIPVGKGTLLFDNVLWQDALGSETEKVTRIVGALAANQGAEVRTASEEITYDYFPIDISKQANMGYYDRVANDGKGGWTDQGENDMRFFLINHVGKTGGLESGMETEGQHFPAEVTMAGRRFWLLDPRKTSDHAVISLRGEDHGALLPSKAAGIAVGKNAESLWFLQAAGWVPPKPEQEVARYIIHYADGSQEAFPIRYGREISEWWNLQPVPGAKVAWSGQNLVHSPVGIYATQWINPHPEKPIATIDVVGNLSPTQIVLLAITGGTIKDPAAKGQVLSDWKMENFDGKSVPNQVPQASPLSAGTLAPTLIETSGKRRLHFQGGQSLSGNLKDVPSMGGLGEGKPVAVRTTFTPESAPRSPFAGLFQAASYGKSGFRVMLDPRMKVVVEIFTGEEPGGHRGVSSSVPIELGRPCTVEVRFDGTYVTLLINGQVDKMEKSALPAPFSDGFLIGMANGKNYDFTGFIDEVVIAGLKEFGR